MRIEISSGGLPGLIAVQDYQFNMQAVVRDTDSLMSCFKTIQSETDSLNDGSGRLQDAMNELSVCLQNEQIRKEEAEGVRKKTNDFLDLAIRVDKQVAVLVDQSRNEFYSVNPWLRPPVPEDEKPWYEQAWDWICGKTGEFVNGIKEAWNWIADTAQKIWDGLVEFYEANKKLIDTIVVIALAVAAVVAVVGTGGAGGLALAPLLINLGASAAAAETISLVVAATAVVSTIGAAAMNVADIWMEIDNPIFNAFQSSFNVISGISNLAYSVGTIYNSVKHITNPKAFVESHNPITSTDQLSKGQIKALNDYTTESCYRNINNSLRGNEVATSQNIEKIKVLDSALDRSSLTSDMTLYRGTTQDVLGELKGLSPEELIGKPFVEKGFMSASSSPAQAKGFVQDMFITMEAPQGSHGLNISSISQFPWEEEFLFARDSEMVIQSAEMVKGVLNIFVRLK